MFIAIIVLLTLASMVICHSIAKNRGGNPVFWGAMGLLFGPFAITFIFLFSKKNSQTA
jgi:uncharacterized membrane protein